MNIYTTVRQLIIYIINNLFHLHKFIYFIYLLVDFPNINNSIINILKLRNDNFSSQFNINKYHYRAYISDYNRLVPIDSQSLVSGHCPISVDRTHLYIVRNGQETKLPSTIYS